MGICTGPWTWSTCVLLISVCEDPLARTVHGTNPQNLIEKITRQKIYNNL